VLGAAEFQISSRAYLHCILGQSRENSLRCLSVTIANRKINFRRDGKLWLKLYIYPIEMHENDVWRLKSFERDFWSLVNSGEIQNENFLTDKGDTNDEIVYFYTRGAKWKFSVECDVCDTNVVSDARISKFSRTLLYQKVIFLNKLGKIRNRRVGKIAFPHWVKKKK